MKKIDKVVFDQQRQKKNLAGKFHASKLEQSTRMEKNEVFFTSFYSAFAKVFLK